MLWHLRTCSISPTGSRALRHSLWVILFSIQDRAGFYEYIMRIATQNNEEPDREIIYSKEAK